MFFFTITLPIITIFGIWRLFGLYNVNSVKAEGQRVSDSFLTKVDKNLIRKV